MLVSVIIPAYNADKYINETIQSVLAQSYKQLEIIIIDDGSTDNTATILNEFTIQNQLTYIYQSNQGVSNARNNGLAISKGESIVFLDADDVLEKDFIKNKISLLQKYDFVGSITKSFTGNTSNIKQIFACTSNNIAQDILFYNSSIVTCPSAYLLKKDFLIRNNIKFNEKLSSTADREFLLQLAVNNVKGKFDESSNSAMLYRLVENSMSHNFSRKLVDDNAVFYQEIIANKLIPPSIKKKALNKGYYILYRSYTKLRNYKQAMNYYLKYRFLFLR